MTRALLAMSLGLLLGGALGGCMAGFPGPMEMDYGDVDEGFPPPAYVATTAPVYYEGRPAYWWGNRWYYRDGPGWGAYREEPAYLREYRERGAPVRQFYGRAHGGGFPGPRPSPPAPWRPAPAHGRG